MVKDRPLMAVVMVMMKGLWTPGITVWWECNRNSSRSTCKCSYGMLLVAVAYHLPPSNIIAVKALV